MSNKIIDGLLNGNLIKGGKVTFDAAKPCFLVEFQGGRVGIFLQMVKAAYSYSEISINGATVSQTARPGSRDFPITTSINSLYDATFNQNGKIAKAAATDLAMIDEVDPNFVTAIHWYNPKAEPKLAPVDIAKWAISADQKDALAKADAYFAAVTKKAELVTAQNALVAELNAYLVGLITTNQAAGSNAWTANGTLSLNVQNGLETQATILKTFTDLSAQYAANGQPAPSFSNLVDKALATTDWVLARVVDFGISPFVYLLPKTGGSVTVLPAVAPTDPSVAPATTPST